MDLRFGAAARRELDAAAEFYDQQYGGLGEAFLDEVQRFVSLLAANPRIGRRVRVNRRSVVLKQFPYRLVYALDDVGILIIAVAHQSQRPEYWGERVEESHPAYVILPVAA